MTTYATASKALPATFKFYKFPDGVICTAMKDTDGNFKVFWQVDGVKDYCTYTEEEIKGFLESTYRLIEYPAMETFQFTCPHNQSTVFTYSQKSQISCEVTWKDKHEVPHSRTYSTARAKGYIKDGDWIVYEAPDTAIPDEKLEDIMEASTAANKAWQHHIEQLDKYAEENKCIVSLGEINAFTEATGAHVHVFADGYTVGYKDDFYDVVTDVMLVTVMDAIRVLESLVNKLEEDYVDDEPCDCCECDYCSDEMF